MARIRNIKISYFRSIYQLELKGVADIAVLSGRNDIGKSNVLKALNLFFNGETDWKTQLNFERDFSLRRLDEVRKTIKGKQFIQVQLTFERGPRYEGSLPKQFIVTKTWFRDSSTPVLSSSLERQFKKGELPTKLDRAQASLLRYLNTVRYEYVPAIKDQNFFTYMLGALQDVILGKRAGESDIGGVINKLNSTVQKEAAALRAEFSSVTGIETEVRLPSQLAELFRAFGVDTKSGKDDMPLSMRGDGIRSRFLPSLLNYISQHSKLLYIWGFEEPENSLELSLASKLADDIMQNYAKHAQVLITSHSPAFFGLKNQQSIVYRVFRDEQGATSAQSLADLEKKQSSSSELYSALEQELGLMKYQEKLQQDFELMRGKLGAPNKNKV